MHDTDGAVRERALLVGLSSTTTGASEIEESLDELALLADTAGAEVVDRVAQFRRAIHPAYYVGAGKAEEIREKCEASDIDLVIFDDDLSPAQVKNLDRIIERRILDRSGLILDIFATRARSRQAKLQVELAQLKYLMPRLTRQWSHLSRQAGGVGSGGAIGSRGPGETQLEVDRRLVRGRIDQLSQELEEVSEAYALQRKQRDALFCVALVGYTNAGKSTVFNALTHAGTLVENRLFATLDSTTRSIKVTDRQEILLSDTVGFIRKLPHHLVSSFKSTLSEVSSADLLLHIVDVSHPNCEEQIYTVNSVLQELGAAEIPAIMVLNKRDRLDSPDFLRRMQTDYVDSVGISALNPEDVEHLRQAIGTRVDQYRITMDFLIPHSDARFVSMIYGAGDVLDREDTAEGVRLTVRVMPTVAGRMRKSLNRYVTDREIPAPSGG